MIQYTMVHAAAPQVRHIRPDNHARVAIGQLRRFIKVAQRLVTTGRVGMVIRVPLKLEQEDIGNNTVAVP
ncbi:hypothetical protein ABVN18_13595 [Pseudomonas canadensis]|uniref:hypothetical protein n=1 Tax=Pseudomonas canadensis TaxID=915099 RepID=UPI00336AC5EE